MPLTISGHDFPSDGITGVMLTDRRKKNGKVIEGVYRRLHEAGGGRRKCGANAIGPMAAVISIIKTNSVIMKVSVPLWVLGLGGVGIVVGLATWGWRVIETIGKKITELTPTRGFSAEFGAATTIVIASRLGMPISTTHTLVGSVLGVGMARGVASLNMTLIRNIFMSWFITLPAGAILSVIFYSIFTTIWG